MTPTEKFEKRNLTFSDRKEIAIKLLTYRKKLKLFQWKYLFFVLVAIVFIYTQKIFIFIVIGITFYYIVSIVFALNQLNFEFKQKYKWVGTFKVCKKRAFKNIRNLMTKYETIRVENKLYETIDINDIIYVEKFDNDKLLKVVKVNLYFV
ncbi:MAG: hypothetical protein ACRCVT_15520 [Leadbetterella sp.]